MIIPQSPRHPHFRVLPCSPQTRQKFQVLQQPRGLLFRHLLLVLLRLLVLQFRWKIQLAHLALLQTVLLRLLALQPRWKIQLAHLPLLQIVLLCFRLIPLLNRIRRIGFIELLD